MEAKLITVLIEYKDDAPRPSFHAQMEALGGTVAAVQFSDALAELESKQSAIDDLVAKVASLKESGKKIIASEMERTAEVIRLRDVNDDLVKAAGLARKQLKLWMKDHGQDIATQEAISEINAALAKAGAA